MRSGYIKVYRSILENPIVMKSTEHFAVWSYLLLEAEYCERETMFGREKITLNPGQLITSRKKIADKLKIKEGRLRNILTDLQNDKQIHEQSKPCGTVISILNWDKYQGNDKQICKQKDKQDANDMQTTCKQDANLHIIKEYKNINNINNNKNNISIPSNETVERRLNEFRKNRDAINEKLRREKSWLWK